MAGRAPAGPGIAFSRGLRARTVCLGNTTDQPVQVQARAGRALRGGFDRDVRGADLLKPFADDLVSQLGPIAVTAEVA